MIALSFSSASSNRTIVFIFWSAIVCNQNRINTPEQNRTEYIPIRTDIYTYIYMLYNMLYIFSAIIYIYVCSIIYMYVCYVIYI